MRLLLARESDTIYDTARQNRLLHTAVLLTSGNSCPASFQTTPLMSFAAPFCPGARTPAALSTVSFAMFSKLSSLASGEYLE